MNGYALEPALGGTMPQRQRQRQSSTSHGGAYGSGTGSGSGGTLLGYLESSVAPMSAAQAYDVQTAYLGTNMQVGMQAGGMAAPIQEPGGDILQLPFPFSATATARAAGLADANIGLGGYVGQSGGTAAAMPSGQISLYNTGGTDLGHRSADAYTSAFMLEPGDVLSSATALGHGSIRPQTQRGLLSTSGTGLTDAALRSMPSAPRNACPIAPRPTALPPAEHAPYSRPDDSEDDHDDGDGERDGSGSGEDEAEPGHNDPTQPWGMPQAQYKALSSTRKKQIRNKVGAKKFRAKRKGGCGVLVASLTRDIDELTPPDPVHLLPSAQARALETDKLTLADANAALAAQLTTAIHEINLLKQALTSAGLPVPALHPVARGGVGVASTAVGSAAVGAAGGVSAELNGGGGYLVSNAGGLTRAAYGMNGAGQF